MNVKFRRVEWVQFGICIVMFILVGVLLWINGQMLYHGRANLKPTGDAIGLVIFICLGVSALIVWYSER